MIKILVIEDEIKPKIYLYNTHQTEEYKNMMVEYKTPKTRAEADKLKFYTKMYGDISQRHDSKIKIFLSGRSC